MRKFYYNLVLALVATMLAVGCTEDLTNDNEVLPIEKVDKVLMDVTASLECDETEGEDTRTTLTDNNGGKIAWSEGDAIGAISSDGTITECVVASINGSSATFSVPTDTIYAFYPYSSSSTYSTDKKLLSHSLLSEITLDGTNQVFGDNENVMCAHLLEDKLAFKNLCGYIEVKLKGTQTVKRVSLHNETGNWEAISGLGTIDFSDAAAPTFTPGTNHGTTFNYIYAASSVALSASEATSFYFIVPPRTYNNLNITVVTDAGSYSVSTTNPITVNRSMIRPLSTINIDALAPTAATDLSAEGVANCYVVPQGSDAKYYSFPARKINGAANLEGAVSAHLSWSEDATIINNVSYDAATGVVSFKYEGGNKEGNAQLVVLNANKQILWAWHIWCTDTPQLLSVRSSDGSQTYGVLDRNLGATYTPKTASEAAAISEEDATDAAGLYYQYGRPAPFPRTSSIKNNTTEATAYKTSTRVAVQYGFAMYSQHFTFSNAKNSYATTLAYPKALYACYFTNATAATATTSGNFYTWYNAPHSSYTEKEYLWYSIDNDVVDKKADNDPCPAGYVVDDDASAAGFYAGLTYTKASWGSEATNTYGYYYECPVSGSLVYLPTAGFRDGKSAKVSYCARNFNIWAVPTATDATNKLHATRVCSNNSGPTTSAMIVSKAYTQLGQGFAIRCRRQDRSQMQNVTVVTTTFEGEGTASSPYLIKTSSDLVKLAGLCDGTIVTNTEEDFTAAHYALAANIDMSDVAFTPISPFKGSFDGKNFTISDVVVTPKGTDPVGLFGVTTDATIKNLNIEGASVLVTNALQLYTGALVGKAVTSTIDNCVISATVSSAAKGSHAGEGESRSSSACVGGVIGWSSHSNISNVTFAGVVGSTAGQYVGGLVSVIEGGSLTKSKFAKGSQLYTTMNNVGGIAGFMGVDATISECTVEAPVLSKYSYHGGLVGRMQSGTLSKSLVTGDSLIEGYKNNATANSYYGTGGLVGIIETVANKGSVALVEDCACYADVISNLYVGGIVGVVNAVNTTLAVNINDCLFKGSITAKYRNSSNYACVGGIVGCSNNRTAAATTTFDNCVVLVDGITFNSTATSAGIGGVVGYGKLTNFTDCYSNLSSGDIISNEGKTIAEYTSITRYGHLGGFIYNTCAFSNCYYLTGRIGATNGTPTYTNVEALSLTQMTDGTLLAKLNASGTEWSANSDGYPVPTAAPANTGASSSESKTRVSIIGDSISTFEGWMPSGYVKYYPISSNPTVISAGQTYWYKLIYKYMSNATLDMNIAWSGTVVARSTDADYLATDHGAGHCFVERFIADGMGNPDVILLHGGTNDVSNRGKSISLYPGYPIYKASGYDASACPTDAEMKVAFDTADAATTRAAIEALDDTTFVYAYVKLLSLMHQQYPSAKVVMIIGDWIPAGTRQAILKIAAHYGTRYGYKCVDLQEISPYCSYDVIPKESGCHPNEAGFEVMANYIYQKVGDYID